jgi:UDP-N-acetylmuramate dehydrogenase
MTLDAIRRDLAARLPAGAVGCDVPVSELTTYRLGGPVAVTARVTSEPDLAAVAAVIAAADPTPAVLVVGRGSNLLVADQGFAAVGVILAGEFEAVTVTPDTATVQAGGAAPLPVVARRSAAVGLTGLEFYVGIPGSVGGAVRMNAGGHGRETRQVLRRAWVVDLLRADPGPQVRTAEDLGLDYRHSALTATEVVTGAELHATVDTPEACEARVAEIVRWRREHQPGGANAGSVFRNPPGDSAGRLIDLAGLKGYRVGGAVVSAKHANFFQAEPAATANDVARLVIAVQDRVEDVTGVRLIPELQMVGFDEARRT